MKKLLKNLAIATLLLGMQNSQAAGNQGNGGTGAGGNQESGSTEAGGHNHGGESAENQEGEGMGGDNQTGESSGNQENGSSGMGGHDHGAESSCLLTSEQVVFRDISEEEADTLRFMREEEKLARDIYQALFIQWANQVFGNIAISEQTHMDKVKVFLDAYDIDDPAMTEAGIFNNQDLQRLYDDLLAKGSQSELEALKVGALVEEVDIVDLQKGIEDTDNDDLKRMYTNLMLASYNHLKAFSRKIITIEGEYVAQLMSAEEVEQILNAPKPVMSRGNALLLDSEGVMSDNDACFVSSMGVDQDLLQNGSTINTGDTITIEHKITANANDLEESIDWVIVAFFNPENSDQTQLFARQGDSWQSWDGQLDQIPSAKTSTLLADEYVLAIFQGQLSGMAGQLVIYSGYRLENGDIVYSRLPTILNVTK